MLVMTPTAIGVASGPETAPTRRGVLAAVACDDCRGGFFVYSTARPAYCPFCGRANRAPGLQDRYGASTPIAKEGDACPLSSPT